MKTRINPMDRANAAPRCSATSKRTRQPCQAPALRGHRVCRSHGARGGAPNGAANGRYVHGRYTCEEIERRRSLLQLIRASVKLLKSSAVAEAGQ